MVPRGSGDALASASLNRRPDLSACTDASRNRIEVRQVSEELTPEKSHPAHGPSGPCSTTGGAIGSSDWLSPMKMPREPSGSRKSLADRGLQLLCQFPELLR